MKVLFKVEWCEFVLENCYLDKTAVLSKLTNYETQRKQSERKTASVMCFTNCVIATFADRPKRPWAWHRVDNFSLLLSKTKKKVCFPSLLWDIEFPSLKTLSSATFFHFHFLSFSFVCAAHLLREEKPEKFNFKSQLRDCTRMKATLWTATVEIQYCFFHVGTCAWSKRK